MITFTYHDFGNGYSIQTNQEGMRKLIKTYPPEYYKHIKNFDASEFSFFFDYQDGVKPLEILTGISYMCCKCYT